MYHEDCVVGMRVMFNTPGDLLIHGETGVVVARHDKEEASVRFDAYKPKYDGYSDTRSGCICIDPVSLVEVL